MAYLISRPIIDEKSGAVGTLTDGQHTKDTQHMSNPQGDADIMQEPNGSDETSMGSIARVETAPSASTSEKRKPGRPKGSKNTNSSAIEPKRPVGRPPGTGPKQQAVLHGDDPDANERRPVGRPKKKPVTFGPMNPPGTSSITGLVSTTSFTLKLISHFLNISERLVCRLQGHLIVRRARLRSREQR